MTKHKHMIWAAGLVVLSSAACGSDNGLNSSDSNPITQQDGAVSSGADARASGADASATYEDGSAPPTTQSDASAPGTEQDDASAAQGADAGGAVTDASMATSGSDAATAPGSVGVFVAQGLLGRTVISCDEGKTWVASRSFDDNARCGNGVDCDHNPGASHGIVFTNGYFIATYGWGAPGTTMRSRDGVNWETVLKNGGYYGGIAVGAGRLMLASTQAQTSIDTGATFTPVAGNTWDITGATVRTVGFADYGSGSFVQVGENGTQMAVTFDAGATWQRPNSVDPACGGSMAREGGFANGKGVFLVVSTGGTACRSLDGGRNFTTHNAGGAVNSTVLWDGQAFLGWGPGMRRRSTDGVTWQSDPIQPAGLTLGAVGRSDTGVFVGVRWGDVDDSAVQFYRSEDGLHWDALAQTAFAPGHPITGIAFGRVAPNSVCKGQ